MTDLWRCTVCGQVSTVGRCCGEETREPWRPIRRKDEEETRRIEAVADRAEQLEAEIERLRAEVERLRERLSALDSPAPTEAEVEAAAKRAAAANSSMHEGCDLELFWSYLDERSQAHWLKVARAALGVG